MAITVELDDWEQQQLSLKAAGNVLTYAGHYDKDGLFRREVDEMNRWAALSAKLSGRPAPEPIPYRGYARNGFNPKAD